MNKDVNDSTEYYKGTVDRVLEDIRKTSYAMIDGKHIGESPIGLVKEAIAYMDDFYRDANNKAEAEAQTTLSK